MKAKELYMYVLGALVVLLNFAFFVAIIIKQIPPENKELIYMAAGIVFGWGSSVVLYFFGSSKGSADKNDLINGGGTKP